VKQISDRLSQEHKHTVHRAVDLDRFQLAAEGGKRSGLDMFWLLLLFMVRVGGNSPSPERVRNCPHVLGFFLKDLLHRKSMRYTGLQNYKIIPLTNLPLLSLAGRVIENVPY
jgi:hypothetical protein